MEVAAVGVVVVEVLAVAAVQVSGLVPTSMPAAQLVGVAAGFAVVGHRRRLGIRRVTGATTTRRTTPGHT